MGWSPPTRSMIARRREPSPTGPATCAPVASGPRWTSVASIAETVAAPSASSALGSQTPAIPHTGARIVALRRASRAAPVPAADPPRGDEAAEDDREDVDGVQDDRVRERR